MTTINTPDATSYNVVIGGEAGQGLVTLGELLAKSLVRAGFHIVVTQTYMSRIRGGHNTFAIRAGTTPMAAPREAVDLLVALDENTIHLHQHALSPRALVVVDEKDETQDIPVLKVPFRRLAATPYENTAALGVTGAILGLKQADCESAVDHMFGDKKPAVLEANRLTMAKAYEWSSTQPVLFPKLAAPALAAPRMMLNGNEALALGALSAGVKFCTFYPMSPSTSIPLTLIKHADAMGVIVEQAEDEIAAINMALGASFAGAPAMVATSGGGFALMAEGVSLAGMTETPLVIIVAQRPGPATGLPTRTEQADLEFVLHAGHGEFPRALLAPGSIEECFTCIRQAFFLADKYQGPVFLLTDQYLADSFRDVVPPDLDTPPVPPGMTNGLPLPYQRYAITDTGISPRLIPGLSPHLVVADSDEHSEDGHITEDLAVRRRMVDKRLRKRHGIRAETMPPVFQGDEKPDWLLVSWGSSRGAIDEAAADLRARGTRTGVLHFPQVWPIVPGPFIDILASARHVASIEGNATGQFARLIRRETGFHIEHLVLRYDGLPFTPETILRSLPHGTQR